MEGDQHEWLGPVEPQWPEPMLLHPVLNLSGHGLLTPELKIYPKYACIESGILVTKAVAISLHVCARWQ